MMLTEERRKRKNKIVQYLKCENDANRVEEEKEE